MLPHTSFENIQEEIASMLSLDDGDLSESQRLVLDAYLDELGEQEAGKVDSFARFITLRTAEAEACRAEAARLAKKAKNIEGRVGWLKEKYLEIMNRHNLKKITGKAYTISARQSEKVAVADMDELIDWAKYNPGCADLVRVKTAIEPDKAAIREALKAGHEIPGCSLAQTWSLRIS